MGNFNNWLKKRKNSLNEDVLQEFGFTPTAPPTVPQQGNPVPNQMYQMPQNAQNGQNAQTVQQTQAQQQQMQNDRQLLYDVMNKVQNPVLKASLDNWLKKIFPKQNMGNNANMNNMGNMPNQMGQY